MTRVKICGITNSEDAQYAVSCGVDYLGLIFAPSPRQIIKETADRIIKSTPGFNQYVGVFLNAKKKHIEDICTFTNIRILQFHGDETPAFCNYFIKRGFNVIKVFRIKDKTSLVSVADFTKVETIFFDTFVHEKHGGTGEVFDWSLIVGSDILSNKKIFISGGLDDHNVRDVIAVIHPYAVDASSKLEVRVGVKDKTKVKLFIDSVKGH